MGAVVTPGPGSGLDVNSIITQLMAIFSMVATPFLGATTPTTSWGSRPR